ncbi:hypothetical protein SAICODRAFT_7666 [Saitoella complicata NRRL Y-17804]|uniref:uncharacterized protein n=1 Tax=Saitoella complicata (strain BCRC 22490 / CBS 7301 / JCM 7358 / NBRC 10748 / NRRL Y-17804) TaxID=698492 RepID=UPI00086750D8|nr:uncharacterized protein SAICODRAFT_7666 [Saitoella complicata NRRL Y-17804]ODQ53076.1 hypothetical protein SAICODRAFT_7666 [Saitoella complicata NRRL Y-17804]
MYVRTDRSYGVNEVLLASVLGAGVFSILGGQPLTIVGVTGPITVFNYTIYNIITPNGIAFFPFMACYVTRFSCDTSGFYVALVYIQKGVQVITDQYESGPIDPSAYLSIVIALLVTVFGYFCNLIGRSPLFWRFFRIFVSDYGISLTVIFFTGFPHIGHMRAVGLQRLPTNEAFGTTSGRDWLVHFWEIDAGHVFLAIPFGFLLTVLFYFDHNVSVILQIQDILMEGMIKELASTGGPWRAVTAVCQPTRSAMISSYSHRTSTYGSSAKDAVDNSTFRKHLLSFAPQYKE